MKKHIPNALTLGNLICGVLAIRAIFSGDVALAIGFVFTAAVLDFFDGLVARLLGVSGELGKQLDSLADNVTFGVVPGFMLLSMSGYLNVWPADGPSWLLFVACLLVPAMATMRLANFNIDTRQSHGFIGMPTPGNTLLVSSLYYLFFTSEAGGWIHQLVETEIVFTLIVFFIAIWQVLPIPLIALKFKTWGLKDNIIRYAFIAISLVLLLVFKVSGVPLVILAYFIFSIIQRQVSKSTLKNT